MMNKLILKLFTKSCYHGDYEPENVPNAVVEKFAELIVRECSLVADRAHAEDMGWNIGEIIKEHFGVEE
jgi:hypothetical protein